MYTRTAVYLTDNNVGQASVSEKKNYIHFRGQSFHQSLNVDCLTLKALAGSVSGMEGGRNSENEVQREQDMKGHRSCDSVI